MGVLRVNDGTALLPDWRNVGCGGAAGSGFTAVTDHFNRANSTTTLGSPWTVVSVGGGGSPAWGISSNQAYCAASYTDGFGTVHSTLAYQDVGSGDVDITVTLAVANNTNGVLLRLSGTATFFFIGSTSIQWFNSGGTVVHPHSSGLASGDVMRVLAVGSSIQVFKNGTLVNSITDTRNQTATRHGMIGDAVFAPSMRLDDFTIAPGVAATTGRLKLWDGTRWMREVCTTEHFTPTYVTGAVNTGVGTTMTVTAPSGIVSGDLLLLSVTTDFTGAGTWTAPTGWTNLSSDGGSGASSRVYSKTATGSESGTMLTITNSFSRQWVCAIRVHRAASGPLSASSQEAFSSVSTLNSVPSGHSPTPFGTVTYFAAGATGVVITAPTDANTAAVLGGTTPNAAIALCSVETYEPTSPSAAHTATSSPAATWGVNVIGFNRAGSPERHPLKMWDGTTWQTVACLTPA